MIEPPTHAYFRPKHGRWASDYVFSVESVRTLFCGTMGFLDKLSFAMLGLLCRLLGSLRIETMVDASELSHARIYHTTRVSKWGVTLQSSEEWFDLGTDGRSLAVTGAVHAMPFRWIDRPYHDSSGQIDESGQRASYEFAWAGSRVLQRSTPEADGLRFVQELDGCRATFVLRSTA
jgi:hypothetical protein